MVALTCNGGGSAAFPFLAFYDNDLNLVASYGLSRISDAESYEPLVTSLDPRGAVLHAGSGTGSADLTWNGNSFDKSNVTVHDSQGNQVTG